MIEDRRTIFPEQFSSRRVHKEIIQKLIDAARWAPTHKLTQPWHFTVFMGEGLSKFGDWHADTYKAVTPTESFMQRKYDKMKSRCESSSAVIVASMKRDEALRVPEIEEIAAASAAVQNMLLLGTAYGLGMYWGSGGMTHKQELKDYLGLKEDDKVLGLIYVGYPEIDWPRKTPRKPSEYVSKFVEE